MKKKDIIQLVKETIKEVDQFGNRQGPSNFQTSAVTPTDEYPFSRRPKRTGTGMMDEEGMSSGLETRQLADSFTFDELEQLYNDKKISKEDLNGAKNYLQAWIDMHPTYLPQRDLTSPKRQKIRARYDTSAAGLTPGDPNWPGEDDRDNFPDPKDLKESPMFKTGIKQDMAPEGMAERIKSVFNKVNGAKDYVQTPEWHKNRFKDKYGISFPEDIKYINKDQAIAMNKYANDMKIKEATYAGKTAVDDMTDDPAYNALDGDAKMQLKKDLSKGGTATLEEEQENSAIQYYLDEFTKDIEEGGRKGGTEYLNNLIAAIENLRDTFEYYDAPTDPAGGPVPSSKFTEPLAEYMKERENSNLMEHMDKHRKRTRLMEGAMKKFFEMFDMGKTDEEIVQDYAQRGTQVPEMFVNKARKQYEGLKKMKLELEMSEKEYKNSATQIVNNPATGEMDGSTTMETKQLATDLFNEEKSINKK
tara:strand:+ start:851 stop:2272 length:1422 start_codon:yes stop_codon:yes gene_type:complete